MKRLTPPWHVLRPILFLVIGLMNTVLIRPGDIGSFKHGLGFVLLIVGLIELSLLAARDFQRHGKGGKDRDRT